MSSTAARPGDLLITLRDVSLQQGRVTVLEKVDLSIARGEFWSVVGPNGAGKSTLLGGILGTLCPTRGEVLRASQLEGRRRIGFVPQRCQIQRTVPTTVREFVRLGMVGLGLGARDGPRQERLEWALNRSGLAGLESHDYWSLSDGQRQRVLIARALVRRPLLLLLDEPTAGLDLPSTERLLSGLVELHRWERPAVVFVTHELSLALRHGTHFALCGGSRAICGSAETVLRRENLQRAYGLNMAVRLDSDRPFVEIDPREDSS